MNVAINDISDVDFTIPYVLNSLLQATTNILGALILASIITPVVSIIIIISFIIFIRNTKKYTRTSTELRRLSQLAETPFLSKIDEMIDGQVEISIYGQEDNYLQEVGKLNERVIGTQLHEDYALVWLGLRLEVYVAVIVLVGGMAIAFSKNVK